MISRKINFAEAQQPPAKTEPVIEAPAEIKFILEPLRMNELKFKSFVTEYLKKVEKRISDSFYDVDTLIDK